jgi:anti-sigma B factor antagonist
MSGENNSLLTIRMNELGDVTVLVAEGELDIAASTQMSDALTTACSTSNDRVAVDVSGLAFIDATGLNVLLSRHKQMVNEGRAGIVVWGAQGIVRRVFEITGLTFLLNDDRQPAP